MLKDFELKEKMKAVTRAKDGREFSIFAEGYAYALLSIRKENKDVKTKKERRKHSRRDS